MDALFICKNEDGPMKMKALERPKHFSPYKYMGNFPDAQGQPTPQSVVGTGRISNSYDILWLSLLTARMKKIQSKMKALEWPQRFPHGSNQKKLSSMSPARSDTNRAALPQKMARGLKSWI